MEVFYLKINRAESNAVARVTLRYLIEWIKIALQFPEAKIYILCDNPALEDYVSASINLDDLNCEFIKSSRDSEELTYIIEKITPSKHWQRVAYAHFTPFLHARDMGYENFWAIDADDMGLYAEPQKIAKVLESVKEYASLHKIDAISLEVWQVLSEFRVWTFGVVYTDNSIDWLNLMKNHCTDSDFLEKFGGRRYELNADWYCTYFRLRGFASLESFYVENLRFIHHADDAYMFPGAGLRYWHEGYCYFPLVYNDYGMKEAGILSIPKDIVKIDIGITAEESMRYLRQLSAQYATQYSWSMQAFQYLVGFNIPVSLIISFNGKNNEILPPPPNSFLIAESLLNQTFMNYQLIIIEGDMTESEKNASQRLYYALSIPNKAKILKGTSTNTFELLNEGIRAAQGKYVVFLNGENIFMNNFVYTLYSIAEQTRADVVHLSNYGVAHESLTSIDGNSVELFTDEVGWQSNKIENVDQNLALRLDGWFAHQFAPRVYNKLFRRAFLLENNISFDVNACLPEWIFVFKSLMTAKNYVKIPYALYVSSDGQKNAMNVEISELIVGIEKLEEFMMGIDFFSSNPEVRHAVIAEYMKKFLT